MSPTILYSCPYIPAEWISAHHLQPARMLPASAAGSPGWAQMAGVCPYVAGFCARAHDDGQAAALVVTTLCDQMRRAFELLRAQDARPIFLFNLPSTWQHPAAHALYRAEVERLGRFLLRLGGVVPSQAELAAVMTDYERARATIRAQRPVLGARAYATLLADYHEHPPTLPAYLAGTVARTGIPLALLGVPLMRASFALLDVIEAAGGRVVLQATENGELTLPDTFDPARLAADPLEELTRGYFTAIPHAFRRPNDLLYRWLAHALEARGAAGILFLRYGWCDLWQAELQRLKAWTTLPVLDLDLGGESGLSARTETRLHAFLEMLA